MTARDVGRIVNDRLRAERRRFELFRKGVVTAIDTSVVPHLATISDGSQARPMPYIATDIAVGDVVQWVDQSDPFCWAKEGSTTFHDPPPDGNAGEGTLFLTFSNLYSRHNTGQVGIFDFRQTQATDLSAFPANYFPGSDGFFFGGLHTQPGTANVIKPLSSVPINAIYENEAHGSGVSSLWWAVAPTDITPNTGHGVRTEWPDKQQYVGHFVTVGVNAPADFAQVQNQITMVGASQIVTTVIASQSGTFPQVTLPSPNWLVFYIADLSPLAPSDPDFGNGLRISGSSHTWDPAIPTPPDGDVELEPRTSTEVHALGDFFLAWEVVTTAGLSPARTFQVAGTPQTLKLTTVVVEISAP